MEREISLGGAWHCAAWAVRLPDKSKEPLDGLVLLIVSTTASLEPRFRALT